MSSSRLRRSKGGTKSGSFSSNSLTSKKKDNSAVEPSKSESSSSIQKSKQDVIFDSSSCSFRPSTYSRNLDIFDDSPYEIPNSQAPIPGREVYWELDTPETKRYREELLRKLEEMDSPSPAPPPARSSPRIRLVSRRHNRRIVSEAEKEKARKGEEALRSCEEMCREVEQQLEREKEKSEPKHSVSLNEDLDSEDMFGEESDMGEDVSFSKMSSSRLGDREGVVKTVHDSDCDGADKMESSFHKLDIAKNITFDDFDDDEDSFLLAATQIVETADMKVETNIEQVEEKSDIFKVPTLINPAVSRLQDESFGFGSDDSFDEHLSQIPIEEEKDDMTDVSMSPVLKKRRTSIHSHKTKMKLSEISPNIVPQTDNSVPAAKPSFKKFSSFDQSTKVETNNVKESTLKRVKSSPEISRQGTCSKEEIDRKKAEAMARKLRDKVETKNIVQVSNTKDLIEEKRKQALARRAASQSQKVLKYK